MSNILKSIKLDHNILKSHYPMFLIAYVLEVVIAVLTRIPVYGVLIVMVISAPLAGQYFSIYEKNNLEKLYGTLPLKKFEVFTGRYMYALCIAFINGVIATVLAIIISILTNNMMSGAEFFTYLSGGFLFFCLMVGVMFPLYFKFTFSKVYILSNLPFYVLFILALAFTRKTDVLGQAGTAAQQLVSDYTAAAVLFGLGIVLLALSCLLSCALIEGNQAARATENKEKRMYFVDNLRTWMVILVVLQHIAEIFGLSLFLMLNQAYFMGLLFLLSGYFTPGSLERKGPRKFLIDRLLRFGIPTLGYVFILRPLVTLVRGLITNTPSGNLFAIDQMWFVVMLFVFDLGYLVWRTVMKKRPKRTADNAHTKLTFSKVAFFTLALAAATYLLRIIVPYGITILQFPSLAYLAQYISFFIVGMLACKRDWLRTASGSLGKIGFVMAILASVILFPIAIMGSNSAPSINGQQAGFPWWIGFGSWQSAVFVFWDSIFAVGISLALITFFRRFVDKGKRFGRFLSAHSFTVYVFHVSVIVFMLLALSGLQADPLVKFALMAVVGLPVCFGVAWLIRKIPGVKKIF